MLAVKKQDLSAICDIEVSLTPTLALKRQHLSRYERKDARKALTFMLMRTANYFNLGKTMNAGQVFEVCDLILEEYPHESLEDFALCFRYARKGRYGKLYDRLDGGVIFGWVHEYMEEKSIAREAETRKRRKEQEREMEERTTLENNLIRKAYERLGTKPYQPKQNANSTPTDEEDYRRFKASYFAGKISAK
ncbi:hypothetical protein FUAX_41880 (plasmid) [Fulvitalea axinellae]|uniref:DUF4373 domain-containing protein n=2 Tax=Fulvitalea axinellae TaxID=1182444 RepID=A0AAU9DF39_9BACT|nr:hypothetical protein FUAX_41880 [Fulvitalea axinellae]